MMLDVFFVFTYGLPEDIGDERTLVTGGKGASLAYRSAAGAQ